jgi:hypothetical protein
MKVILITSSVITLSTLIIAINNIPTIEKAPPAKIADNSYEIEKIKLEIEMLECDRVFIVRPDNVIEKELNIANDKLKKIVENQK